MRKINWGIIGLGKMALEFAKCFSYLDNVNLKCVHPSDCWLTLRI